MLSTIAKILSAVKLHLLLVNPAVISQNPRRPRLRLSPRNLK